MRLSDLISVGWPLYGGAFLTLYLQRVEVSFASFINQHRVTAFMLFVRPPSVKSLLEFEFTEFFVSTFWYIQV